MLSLGPMRTQGYYVLFALGDPGMREGFYVPEEGTRTRDAQQTDDHRKRIPAF